MNWNKLRNPGTILGIVSTIGLLLVQFGVKVDLVWLNETTEIVINLLCMIGVLVSAANNPETKGIDNPFK